MGFLPNDLGFPRLVGLRVFESAYAVGFVGTKCNRKLGVYVIFKSSGMEICYLVHCHIGLMQFCFINAMFLLFSND